MGIVRMCATGTIAPVNFKKDPIVPVSFEKKGSNEYNRGSNTYSNAIELSKTSS